LKKRWELLTIFLLIISFLQIGFAQAPDTLWTRTYGGIDRENGNCVKQTFDNGYIITGITESFRPGYEDIYLIKTDINGDTMWTNTYGFDSGGKCYYVIQTPDSGYILCGSTQLSGAPAHDVLIIKTDANGDTLWTRTYGGLEQDKGSCIQQIENDGFIILGETYSYGAGERDFYLIRINNTGDTLWTKTFGGILNENPQTIEVTSDGGFIMSGNTESFGSGNSDYYLVRADSNGDTLWTRTYGGVDNESGGDVKQTSDSGFVLVGGSASFGQVMNAYIVRTDLNGDTLWTKSYGGIDADWGYRIQETTDNGFFISGGSRSFGAGNFDIYLIRINSDGNLNWTKTVGGQDNEYTGSILNTNDGGYVIIGSTESFGNGDYDIYMIKTAPDPTTNIQKFQNKSQKHYFLLQNYPNPFNPSTNIEFILPKSSHIKLTIFDTRGKIVEKLVDKRLSSGIHNYDWNAIGVSSGIYFYQIKAGEFIETKKLILLR